MPTSAAQREEKARIATPPIRDLVGAYVERNPSLPRREVERAGRVAAALGTAAVELSEDQQLALLARKGAILEVLVEVLERLEGDGVADGESAPASSLVEESVGDGLSGALALTEGRRRLTAYATPMRLEDWAGDVEGPGELERLYGIPRSTLHDWHSQRQVVGLLKGVRKHVFPVAQFVDGRPVTGLRDVLETVGNARTAWAWLIEPHPSLGGRAPLDGLKSGKAAAVADLAERDFGQP